MASSCRGSRRLSRVRGHICPNPASANTTNPSSLQAQWKSKGDVPAAYYVRVGAQKYLPTPYTVGPWAPNKQHAGPVSALMLYSFQMFQVKDAGASSGEWHKPLSECLCCSNRTSQVLPLLQIRSPIRHAPDTASPA